jgi:hypothetical protein
MTTYLENAKESNEIQSDLSNWDPSKWKTWINGGKIVAPSFIIIVIGSIETLL